ncbi:hypothetical protein EMIT0P4_150026 [Pseudomonas sp. IT-P4]
MRVAPFSTGQHTAKKAPLSGAVSIGRLQNDAVVMASLANIQRRHVPADKTCPGQRYK